MHTLHATSCNKKHPMLSITLPPQLSIQYPKQTKKKTVSIQVHPKKAIKIHHHPHIKPPSSSLTPQPSSPPTTTTTTTLMAATTLIMNPKTTTNILYSTACTLLMILCYTIITRWLRWRRRSPSLLPPGPAGVPILGNLLTLHPELHTHFTTLAKTHGPIFTIKLGNRLAIVISGVDEAKEVLRQQDDNFANRIIPAACKTHIPGSCNQRSPQTPPCPASPCPSLSKLLMHHQWLHHTSRKSSVCQCVGNSQGPGNDFRYFPFGSGRRICAGIAMAERMVGYALASLLHSFDWNLPEGTKLDLSERFGIVLKKAKPLVAVPTPRLSQLVLHSWAHYFWLLYLHTCRFLLAIIQ